MKDESVYLKHVLRSVARIEQYTAAGRESFFSSPLIQDAVIRNLQTLAESSQRLSESIKERGVDLVLVYRAVEQDVPRLKRACEAACCEAALTRSGSSS